MRRGNTPVVPGVLYGLRSWKVVDNELSGPFFPGEWPHEGPARARCPGARHSAPQPNCGCGLYAMHPTEESARLVFWEGDGSKVGGIVASWGPVEVHADGLRARYGRPHAFVVDPRAKRSYRDRVDRIAKAYGAAVLVATPDQLLAHCREHGLGLNQSTVHELLKPAGRLARRRIRLRAAAASVAGTGVLAGLLIAFNALVPKLDEWLSTPPAPIAPEVRELRILEEHVLGLEDGDLAYLAVVRNEHPTKTALGVFTAGSLRTRAGTRVAYVDERLAFDGRAIIPPGGTAVVFDVLETLGDLSGRVARYRTRPLARAFRRTLAQPPVRVGKVTVDSKRCLLTATVTSDRTRTTAEVVVLAYGRSGRLKWVDFPAVGPLRRGRTPQVRHRIRPGDCASPPVRVAAYPVVSDPPIGR